MKKQLSRMFLLILGLLFCNMIFYTKEKEGEGMTIHIHYPSLREGQVLDPAKLRYTVEYTYIQNLTLNLFEVNSKSNYEAQLAKTMKVNAQKNEYRIKIRKAYYSNGDKITAQDVALSFKRAILRGTPHFDAKELFKDAQKLKSIHDKISGIEVFSEDEIIIRINHSSKELLYYLQLTDLGILHSTQYEKEELFVEDWMNVTSGPYHIKKDNSTLILEANESSLNFSKKMPKKIIPSAVKNQSEIIEEIRNKKYDLGIITPMSYLKLHDKLRGIEGLDIYGNKHEAITILALNIKNPIFSSLSTRRWFLKKILINFNIPHYAKEITDKATQFFLPETKGFISNANILNLLDDVNIEKIPAELKKGITIKSLVGMKGYLLPHLKERLEEALGINVKIDMTLSASDYIKTLESRNYEVLTTAISMSYKVLGETLNFQYLNQTPIFQDPQNKIKPLLAKYQNLEDKNEEYEVIKKIMKQMTRDAECIPLYYYGRPTFFQSHKIDSKKLYLDEAIQFWRIRVKS